jgi:hypothetical protein
MEGHGFRGGSVDVAAFLMMLAGALDFFQGLFARWDGAEARSR